MSNILIGLFKDSKLAGDAVSDFKNKGFTNEITVVSQEYGEEPTTHEIEKDVSQGTTTGATAGAAVGTLAGLLSGVSSFVLPGAGLVVLGPLASLLTGLGGGALAGGLVGALTDWGVPSDQAQTLEDRVNAGEVLVGITVTDDNIEDARAVFNQHQADLINTIETK